MLESYPFLMVMNGRAGMLWTVMRMASVVFAIGFIVMAISVAQMMDQPMALLMMWPAPLIAFGLYQTHRGARYYLPNCLQRFGGMHAVGPSIEADFPDAPDEALLQIGQRWLVYVGKEVAYVGKLNEVVWVGLMDRSLNIVDHTNGETPLYMSQAEGKAALAQLQAKIPWAVFGYSTTIARSWAEDPRDMHKLIREAYEKGVRFTDVAPAALQPTSGVDTPTKSNSGRMSWGA